jgi:predicted Zn-dependent protease
LNRQLLALGCGLMLIGVSSATDPLSPSIKQQIRLGQQAAGEIRRENKVLPASDPRVILLRKIGHRILRTFPDSEQWEYSFDVIDSKEINAFALPGGPTFFYTGLLDRLKTEDEIAGIMGHELTHVRHQHWAKMYRDGQKKALFIDAALLLLHVNYTGASLAEIANTLYDLKYSRADEAEADQGGYENAVNAGYNPQGLADSFAMLDKLGGRDPEFLSDHPSNHHRVETIESEIAASGKTYPAQTPLPWPAKTN